MVANSRCGGSWTKSVVFVQSPKAVLLWEMLLWGPLDPWPGQHKECRPGGSPVGNCKSSLSSPKDVSLDVLRSCPSLAVQAGRAVVGCRAAHQEPVQWPRGQGAGGPLSQQALACTAPFRAGSGQLPLASQGCGEPKSSCGLCWSRRLGTAHGLPCRLARPSPDG